jgi:hypothetical protein
MSKPNLKSESEFFSEKKKCDAEFARQAAEFEQRQQQACSQTQNSRVNNYKTLKTHLKSVQQKTQEPRNQHHFVGMRYKSSVNNDTFDKIKQPNFELPETVHPTSNSQPIITTPSSPNWYENPPYHVQPNRAVNKLEQQCELAESTRKTDIDKIYKKVSTTPIEQVLSTSENPDESLKYYLSSGCNLFKEGIQLKEKEAEQKKEEELLRN